MRSARLKELGEIITGNTPKTSEIQNYESDDICFVKPSDIDDKSISKLKNSEYYISEYARKSARIAPKHSILVTCIGTIGKIAILENECAFNQQINAIIPDEKQVYPLYLAYNMFFQKKYLQQKANAPVVPIINKTDFGDFKIKLHNLIEQQKIIDVLDKIENLIDNRQQQLNLLNELIESRFIEMFGDPILNNFNFLTQKLGKTCILKAGITTSPKDIYNDLTEEHNVPCFGGNGIRGYVKRASFSGEYPIIGRQGALCGNLQFARGTFHATEHAVLVTPVIEYNKKWLYFMLKYMKLNRFSTGAAQPGLSVTNLNHINIIVPPIELQNKFAAFVEQTEKTKSTIKKSFDELNLLKDSLMQKYFG